MPTRPPKLRDNARELVSLSDHKCYLRFRTWMSSVSVSVNSGPPRESSNAGLPRRHASLMEEPSFVRDVGAGTTERSPRLFQPYSFVLKSAFPPIPTHLLMIRQNEAVRQCLVERMDVIRLDRKAPIPRTRCLATDCIGLRINGQVYTRALSRIILPTPGSKLFQQTAKSTLEDIGRPVQSGFSQQEIRRSSKELSANLGCIIRPRCSSLG